MTISISRLAALILLTTLVAGCGGGSGGGTLAPTPGTPPVSGIEGSGIALGTITGFGSVIVNGVRYDTDGAQITVDSALASEADLSIGDVVVVTGTIASDGLTGTAERIRLDHIVEGPITALDSASASFVVLGQTVSVDDATVFDDSLTTQAFAGLNVGDRVEVSGFFDGAGAIVATRIERGDANDELELSGIVAALDTGASTFEIGGQAVDFSAAVLDDFPAGGIAVGQQVEVYAGGVDGGGRLVATRVEYYDELDDLEDGDELEIEGFVSRFASPTDFDVAGISVTTTNGTEFEGGSAADLAVNVRLEVEGELNGNGVLVADEIKFRTASRIRIATLVDAVDSDSLVLLGITVKVDALTSFEDSSDARVSRFGIGDIRVGDFVEVRGREEPPGSGELLATRLERDDADNETSLRGPVQAVMQPTLTILGVTVETSAQTDYEDDDQPITAAEFFSRAVPGTLVEASGEAIATSTILADELELE